MTSAQQELVRLDKKAEIVLEDGRFVTIFKVKLGHVLSADDPSPLHQAVKLISLVTLFDDKKPTIEEILNLDVDDFHKIMYSISK